MKSPLKGLVATALGLLSACQPGKPGHEGSAGGGGANVTASDIVPSQKNTPKIACIADPAAIFPESSADQIQRHIAQLEENLKTPRVTLTDDELEAIPECGKQRIAAARPAILAASGVSNSSDGTLALDGPTLREALIEYLLIQNSVARRDDAILRRQLNAPPPSSKYKGTKIGFIRDAD